MFRSVLLDKELWTEHLKLDSITGLDPEPGIKIRAAQGRKTTKNGVNFFFVGVDEKGRNSNQRLRYDRLYIYT